MNDTQTEPRTPTILLISSGAQWEADASRVAAEANIRWVPLQSVSEFLQVDGSECENTLLLVDAQHKQVNWEELHNGMLENRIEIPIVVAVPEKDWMDSVDSVTHAANFVISHPIDKSLMLETVHYAYESERLVRHRFAVERSYQRLVTLNERERSILTLAVGGSPNKQIARKLGFHIKTIERVRNIAYNKLKVRSTAEMTRLMTLAEMYEFTRPVSPPPHHMDLRSGQTKSNGRVRSVAN